MSGIELSCAHLSMYDQSASFVYLRVPSKREPLLQPATRCANRAAPAAAAARLTELDAPQTTTANHNRARSAFVVTATRTRRPCTATTQHNAARTDRRRAHYAESAGRCAALVSPCVTGNAKRISAAPLVACAAVQSHCRCTPLRQLRDERVRSSFRLALPDLQRPCCSVACCVRTTAFGFAPLHRSATIAHAQAHVSAAMGTRILTVSGQSSTDDMPSTICCILHARSRALFDRLRGFAAAALRCVATVLSDHRRRLLASWRRACRDDSP